MSIIHKLNNAWSLDKPKATTFKEWHIWKVKTKKEYPIRWFLQEKLPIFINYRIISPLKELYWNFMHRFIKKYQYHIIRTGLKPNYYDPDTLIIESNFKILCDFVEFEKTKGFIYWKESSKEHAIAWYEMNSLCDWWKNVRPNREKWLDEYAPYPDKPKGAKDSWVFDEDYRDSKERKEWTKISKIRFRIEENWDKEDEENLIRLMKIRLFMWH